MKSLVENKNKNREELRPPGRERTTNWSIIGSGVSCTSATFAIPTNDARKDKADNEETEIATLRKEEANLLELLKLIQTTATKMEETAMRQKNVNMTLKKNIKTILEAVDIELNECTKTASR